MCKFLLHIYKCRFRCNTSKSLVTSAVDVNLLVSRTGSVQTATLIDGFRYAVSYKLCGRYACAF